MSEPSNIDIYASKVPTILPRMRRALVWTLASAFVLDISKHWLAAMTLDWLEAHFGDFGRWLILHPFSIVTIATVFSLLWIALSVARATFKKEEASRLVDHLTKRPFQKQDLSKKQARIYMVVAIAAALLIIIGTFFYYKPPSTIMQLGAVIALPDGNQIAAGRTIKFRVPLVNKGLEPAKRVALITATAVTWTRFSEEDEENIIEHFRDEVRIRLAEPANLPTIGIGESAYKEAETGPLEASQASAILNVNAEVFLFYFGRWEDSNYHRGSVQECLILPQPTSQTLPPEIKDWEYCHKQP